MSCPPCNLVNMYMCMQAGKERIAPLNVLKGPGALDVTPPASAAMEQNAIQQMGHVPAQLVGMGHTVTRYAR